MCTTLVGLISQNSKPVTLLERKLMQDFYVRSVKFVCDIFYFT